jgi:hypothetical protein
MCCLFVCLPSLLIYNNNNNNFLKNKLKKKGANKQKQNQTEKKDKSTTLTDTSSHTTRRSERSQPRHLLPLFEKSPTNNVALTHSVSHSLYLSEFIEFSHFSLPELYRQVWILQQAFHSPSSSSPSSSF